ncbi:S8 family serine peptidase [Rhodovastum sp. RN2-1]|uniref:S8 family serine peptidase n=1 Tax=Limobrevibacterium gyesilva TaxID=2991712 RepID=A0AA41YQ85_9PROT|nr:S8 family serine peptidase [Limobrevibacterium gyesilva]
MSQVVAGGISYFTSASNEGSTFYQHGFQGIRTTLPGLSGNYLANNFATAAKPSPFESLTIAKGATATIDLQWDDPFASIGSGHEAASSLGMVLYDSNGKIVAYMMKNDVGGNPNQIMQFTNTTASTSFRLAIVTNGGGTTPNLFKFIVYGQGTAINDPAAGKGSGSVIGHELVAGANTVGAVAASATPVFGGNNHVESFSSAGPGMILFDADGNRMIEPARPGKVEFMAPDGVATSVFSQFYGTSAAAPDAAAVAALMLQQNPSLTPGQITAMLARSAVAATGPAGATGAGLIQATTAVQLAAAAPRATPATSVLLSYAAPEANSWAQAAAAQVNPVGAAIAAVLGEPGALADFTAFIDPADAVVMPGADGPGAGTDSFAMLNNGNQMVVPIYQDWGRA